MRNVVGLVVLSLVFFSSTALFLLFPNLPAYYSDAQKTVLISFVVLIVGLALILIVKGKR